MDPKIDTFWPDWHSSFVHFGGRKSRFLDFFKVVLDLFGKCLGFVFCRKRPTFVLFATHNWVSPLGSREALINVDKASSGVFIVWLCSHNIRVLGSRVLWIVWGIETGRKYELSNFSPADGTLKGPLRGPLWASFSFIFSPRKLFLTFNLPWASAHFWPSHFF